VIARRILLVEDEKSLVLAIHDRLASEGYAVEVAGDGDAAVAAGTSARFDCIILDIALPKRDGFDVCRTLRSREVQTPILMLTARGQIIDRVVGLKLGADDYLTKPFDFAELLARLEALMRRSRTLAAAEEAFAFGDVQVDFRRAEVRREGEAVELSTLELKLLRYFVEHRGVVLSRDELLDRVWGYDATPVTRTVDVHVASLRQKIGQQVILTVHGAGYKFLG
jgi:two-component system alkaline phosphatase synthesis response regulator PhoP